MIDDKEHSSFPWVTLAMIVVPPMCISLLLIALLVPSYRATEITFFITLGLALFLSMTASLSWASMRGRATRPETVQGGPEEARESLGALVKAIRIIGGNTDLEKVIQAIDQAARAMTLFESCAIYLYMKDVDTFVLRNAQHGHEESMSLREVRSLTHKRYVYGGSYFVPGVSRTPNQSRQWNIGDRLMIPLMASDEQVIGLVVLDHPSDSLLPEPGFIEPVEAIAMLAATVLVRLRDYHATERLASLDGLTGLLNRRSLELRLKQEIAVATANDQSLALLMIDLDNFGAVNNTYGHEVGDRALCLVSSVISEQLREGDSAGRYGGDEFTILLPDLDAKRAGIVAERLRAALVEEANRMAISQTLPQLHTSIGVAIYPRDAADAESLKKRADEALYVAKGLGKNAVWIIPAA